MGSKRIPTMEGEIEYETVTCDSCDVEVAKQNATRYVSGNIQERKDWGVLGHISYEFDRDVYEGWICDECGEEEGVISLTVMSPHSIVLDGMQAMLVVAIVGFILLTLLTL